MNYIVKNQELERAESYLKNLSNHLKETYEERGQVSLCWEALISHDYRSICFFSSFRCDDY